MKKGKKLKKWLSGIAAMAMAFSMMATGVNAESLDATRTKGSVTITKEGSTFTAYKVLDATVPTGGGAYEWAYNADFKDFETANKDHYSIEKMKDIANGANNHVITLDSVDTGLAPALEKYITDKGNEITGITLVSGKTTELDLGYYIILETTNGDNATVTSKPILISVPEITSSNDVYDYNYDVTVTVKDQEIDITKTIEEAEEATKDSIAQQVGKEYTFNLTSTVPDYNSTYEDIVYKVTDTMSDGLDFVAGSVEVTGVLNGNKTTVPKTAYTVSTEPTGSVSGVTLTVDFSGTAFANIKDYDQIIISYKAKLNKNAVVGVDGNLNTAKLDYTREPGEDKEPGTTEDKAKTFTGGLQLTKINSAGEKLAGAEFTVYGSKLDDEGNAVIDEENIVELITYKVNSDGTITAEKNDSFSATATTDKNGVVKFEGLGAGTYFIKETKAPTGYVVLKNPIKVVVTVELPSDITTGDETATFHYEVTGDGVSSVTMSVDKAIVTFNVENSKGFTLPTTGGAGTYLFTIGGAILMLAAASVFIISRRKANTK